MRYCLVLAALMLSGCGPLEPGELADAGLTEQPVAAPVVPMRRVRQPSSVEPAGTLEGPAPFDAGY